MKSKRCFKCGEVKALAEFYKHPMMGDGHLGKCKECTKRDAWIHRRVNGEKVRAYDRERSKRPDRASKRAIAGEKRRKAHPYKLRANMKLRRAVRSGKIKKQPCIVCGTTERVVGHHEDYSKPLDVIWFCQMHHMRHHAAMDAAKKANAS